MKAADQQSEKNVRVIVTKYDAFFVSRLIDQSIPVSYFMKSQDLTDECLKKAEYYSRMIREAFDDSTWPEETVWEKEIAEQTEESGEKAA